MRQGGIQAKNANQRTFAFVSFVQILVNFEVKILYRTGHRGLYKEHKS